MKKEELDTMITEILNDPKSKTSITLETSTELGQSLHQLFQSISLDAVSVFKMST